MVSERSYESLLSFIAKAKRAKHSVENWAKMWNRLKGKWEHILLHLKIHFHSLFQFVCLTHSSLAIVLSAQILNLWRFVRRSVCTYTDLLIYLSCICLEKVFVDCIKCSGDVSLWLKLIRFCRKCSYENLTLSLTQFKFDKYLLHKQNKFYHKFHGSVDSFHLVLWIVFNSNMTWNHVSRYLSSIIILLPAAAAVFRKHPKFNWYIWREKETFT